MKNIIKKTTAFCMTALAILILSSCEGADLYSVNAPDWLADMEAEEPEVTVVEVTPTPDKLGNTDNTTGWWSVFTEDIKTEPGMTYQVKFINYGGNANYKNFLIVLRNEAKDKEYAVLRSDNWGWTSDDTDGANSDKYFVKRMESENRDWSTWLKAMNLAKCTATIANYGNGKADVKITMLGADNVTYTQEYTDISVNQDDLYFCFTCEGSHLEFGDFDVEDSEPTALTLNGVPSEVVAGTEFDAFKSTISATVTFAEGVSKDITSDDLLFEVIPDFGELGQKTLVAIYNKTYMGNNSSTPVMAYKTFSVVKELSAFTQTVVVPTPLILGMEDNTTGWWTAHTDNIKVEPKETKVVNFTNFTNGATNWNNFCIVLNKASLAEYAVVRADNYGWGDGYAACTPSGGQADWEAWLAAMNGAKVTAYITNNGDGTADIKAVMHGTDGVDYVQEYKGINTIDPDDFYFRFTCEGAHLVFDNVVGMEDNTTGWWTAHSPNVQVKAHQVCTVSFTNFTNGATNWNNFCVVLNKANLAEYAVVRADNYGWGDGYAACTPSGGQTDWGAWLAAMNGAKVSVKIANNGDGTADIKVTMLGTDGVTYKQDYIGINTIDPDDFYFRFTCEGAHLVFE